MEYKPDTAQLVRQYCESLIAAIDKTKSCEATTWNDVAKLAYLPEAATEAIVKTICESMSQSSWENKLLHDVIGPDRQATAGRIKRLHDSLNAIPDIFGYVCLCKAYGGKPDDAPRSGRIEHYDNALENVPEICDIFQQNALKFLKKPSRQNYILTGDTDLNEKFHHQHIATLNANAIFVINDIETRPPDELMRMKILPRVAEDIFGAIYRIKHDYLARTGAADDV